MRRFTSIALLSMMLAMPFARDRDRDSDVVRFIRQIVRLFVGSTSGDDLTPPKPCPPTGCP